MTIVDTILKRWAKDITQLKAAAVSERKKIVMNDQVIDGLRTANQNAEHEAQRAETIVDNLQKLLAVPTENGAAS